MNNRIIIFVFSLFLVSVLTLGCSSDSENPLASSEITSDELETAPVDEHNFYDTSDEFETAPVNEVSISNIQITSSVTNLIPTAFVNNYIAPGLDQSGNLVDVTINNSNSLPILMEVECEIDGYSSIQSTTVTIPANSTQTVSLTPLILENQFRLIQENRSVNYKIRSTIHSDIASQQIYNNTIPAQMLANDVFIFRPFGERDSRIGLWVTPNIEEINTLINSALPYTQSNSFYGYQHSPQENGYRERRGVFRDNVNSVSAGVTRNVREFEVNSTMANKYLNLSFSGEYLRIIISNITTGEDVYNNLARSGSSVINLTENGTYRLSVNNDDAWFLSRSTTVEMELEYDEKVAAAQIKAIYETLQNDYEITYVNSVISYSAGHSQRIRYPVDAINNKVANCIDGAVLFAAAIEKISMQPVIAYVPGHAFVGWRKWRNSSEMEFLETTVVNQGSFDYAFQQGMEQFEEHTANGTIQIVDIKSARDAGIIPNM